MPAQRRGSRAAAVTVLAGAGVAAGVVARSRRVGRGPRLAASFPEAHAALDALQRARLTVGVAESCTGGLLGAVLTAVPGSSRSMRGGVIAYADGVKRELLGIPADLLERCGAVSEPVAEAMAVGVRQAVGADVGLAITGVAGPGAEGTDKPAGLVVVCASGPGERRRTVVLRGDRGREENRAGAVRVALRLCADAAAS